MAKRFKLKFSRVMPSFQLCRSKNPSNLVENPGPVIRQLSPVNPKALDISFPNLPDPPPSTPDDSFIKRHLSPKVASVGCGCRARSWTQYLSPDFSFESEETSRLHRVAKAQNSIGDTASVLVSKVKVDKKKKKMREVKAIASVSPRDSGCFSSEGTENEETETLISTSRTFSDDSSFELEQSMAEDSHMETRKNKKKLSNRKKIKRLRSFGSKKYKASSKPNVSKTKTGAQSSENIETPAGGSTLRRLMVTPRTAEGKVRESVAVVKKSEDPYEDFKSSMLEMILEKQMFEAKDLEQLLQCFLSLNSRQYHGIIVEAFTEIWEALFCDYPMNVL